MRFAPAFLSFLPLMWGDYWIVALDRDYRWAVVGERSRKYLSILNRTRTLDGVGAADVAKSRQPWLNRSITAGELVTLERPRLVPSPHGGLHHDRSVRA